jgi:flagellar biosynthesis/type III secretory pathway M-ring protein FliF/YscJ
MIEAKILELSDKNNVSNVTEVESPTGAITTKVMGADFGTAIGALAIMGLVLALLLSGSYALERHRHKKEQKEQKDQPKDDEAPPVLNAPEIEKITEEAKDVDELLK